MINLSYAIFFMCGREIKRQTERFDAEEKLSIFLPTGKVEAHTINISEGGLAFAISDTYYFPEDRPIQFAMHSEEYYAEFTGSIVFVKKNGTEWNYSVKIQHMDEKNRRQYLQFVYDRVPTFPEKLDAWVNSSDDLLNNAQKRIRKQRAGMRGLPRISINQKIFFVSGEEVWADNFNFKYLLVKGKLPQSEMVYLWRCDYDLYMYLQEVMDTGMQLGKDMHLMKIVNYEELSYNEQFLELVNIWVERENKEEEEKCEFYLYVCGAGLCDVFCRSVPYTHGDDLCDTCPGNIIAFGVYHKRQVQGALSCTENKCDESVFCLIYYDSILFSCGDTVYSL